MFIKCNIFTGIVNLYSQKKSRKCEVSNCLREQPPVRGKEGPVHIKIVTKIYSQIKQEKLSYKNKK